jgi:L-ascorbate metabolism protein UlaG (beta-lactamase superfamily)
MQNQIMHWAAVLIFAFLAVFMPHKPGGIFTERPIRISYTGNMGVVVSSNNATWWFDGIHDIYKPEYQHLPDSIFQQALSGKAPYNNLKGVTFSHHHRDHFSAPLTAQLMLSHRSIVVTGSHQVGDYLSGEKFINGWNKNGIIYRDETTASRLEAYNLAHTWPSRHSAVQNIMYSLLLNGVRITHIGDADIDAASYHQTAFTNADILIVPSWFLSTAKGRDILNTSAAKTLIVTHISPGHKLQYEGKLNARVFVFDEIGETICL